MARYRLDDQWMKCKSDKAAYIEVLRSLHRRVPDLLERLRDRLRTVRRTFFARIPDDLFLWSPHLVGNESNYHQITPGWFADTNLSNESKELILIEACAIAGVSYTYDVEVEFTTGHRPALSKAHMNALLAELDAMKPPSRPASTPSEAARRTETG